MTQVKHYPTMAQRKLARILPADLYTLGTPLDKKSLHGILGDVAKRYPDKYPDIVKQLNDLGIETARLDGSSTFAMSDLTTPVRAKLRRSKMREAITKALDSLSTDEANTAIRQVLADNVEDDVEEIYQDSKADNHPLAIQVDNAGKGNKSGIASMRGGSLAAKDADGKVIPILIDRSYSQGLTPAMFRAMQHGARSGVVQAKLCCAGDTLVRMANGKVKRLDSIQQDDWVLGADRRGRVMPVRVKNRWDNGLRNCHTFVFRLGCSATTVKLTATEDHKILSQVRRANRGRTWDSDREIRLRPLSLATASVASTKGFFHAIRTTGSAFSEHTGLIHQPLAYVIGLMLGNGCMAPSTRGTYQLSIGDASTVEDMRTEFARFGLHLNYSSGYSYTLALPSDDRYDLFVERSMGGVRQRGHLSATKRALKAIIGEKLAHEKVLPTDIWSWDDESCRQLIAGLILTDGSCKTDNKRPAAGLVSFSSTSLKMLRQLQRLLSARFGIHANSIYEDDRAERNRPCFAFVISCPFSVHRLYELIADRLSGDKRKKFDILISGKHMSGRCAYEANKIVRVDTCGVVETYDLEVDHPDHMYVLANGLIVSNSVASSGYANKTMAQAVHRLVVSKIDDDTAIGRGLPVAADEADNDGALLAQDYGPYKRNTYITPKIRKDLVRLGHSDILVRSPISSGAPDGGLLAMDLGERHYGRLAEIGQFANLAASNAIGESVTQATLNAKHNSAIKPADLEDLDDEFKLSGFELIDKVLNPSSERRGFAVHSDEDGRIGLIRNAPQGGQFVMIGMKQHYLPVGSKLLFKPGDEVEAGDQLTEGIPDHVSVTTHQGIGEGRRRVADALNQALRANGQRGHRRNLEVLARGLVDRVRMTEEVGDYIPDDVVPYHRVEAEWQPRENSQTLRADRAGGKYLEKPVLHYSIGTKLRPSVIKMLQKHNVSDVTVNDNPPPFEPVVVRATDIMQTDPDWMSRQLGGHTVRSFEESVLRGRSSDTAGTSYIGARAELKSFNRGSNVIKLDAPATNAPIIP